MDAVIGRQFDVDLFSSQHGHHFQHKGEKRYAHISPSHPRIFNTKKALRKALSQDSGGAWVEEKKGKKRYLVDDSGWLKTSFRQVSKEEYLQRLESPSTLQKVLGVGLGILALLPAALEIKERLPFGAKETGMGLLALQQKSPFLGALGCSFLPSSVEAQAVGNEFQVNSYTNSQQIRPAIAPLNIDGFVISWISSDQDGDFDGIFAQKYHADGTPFGLEFQINNYTTSFQRFSAVTSLNDGGFVVAWESNGQDGDGYGIFAQRYTASGTLLGLEFQVNNYTTNNQQLPAVAPLNDGGFVVAWQSNGQDGDLEGIFAQRYDGTGALFGSEFQVNSYRTSYQQTPAVASLNDGGFVVSWESNLQDGDVYGIFGQRYFQNSTKAGEEFQINTYFTNSQRYPNIATLIHNKFLVTWQSYDQGDNLYGVFGRVYHMNGTAASNEFHVNTHTPDRQHFPCTVGLNDGRFVIIWQSENQDGDGSGIFGQGYFANGTKDREEFQVNSYETINQQYPSVAGLADGGFIVTWQSNGQDGNGWGIFGQRFDQSGNPVPLTYQPPPDSSPLSTELHSSSSQTSNDVRTTNTPNSQLSLADLSTSTNRPPSASSTEILSTEEWISTISRVSLVPSNIPSSSRSTTIIHSIYAIEYGESYSITENGQIIGTYSISGGDGLYNSANPNVLEIQLDPNHGLEDGDTVTLFIVPDGEEPAWEDVILSNDESECISVEGVYVEDPEEHSYQLIFNLEPDTCAVNQGLKKLSAIPVLASGGLI